MFTNIWMLSMLTIANLLTSILRIYYRKISFACRDHFHSFYTKTIWNIYKVFDQNNLLLLHNRFDNKRTHFRSYSYNEKSILTTIFQYNIELINFLVTFTTLSILIICSMAPAPFLLVQMFIIILSCIWTLAFLQGFAISCLKLLLVTHFHVMFPLDPDELGLQIFILSLALAVIPNGLIGVYLTQHESPASKFVHLATTVSDSSPNIIPYNFIYTAFWAISCVTMLVVAVIYIPFHLKKSQQNNAAIQTGEAVSDKKSPNIKKMLLVFVMLFSFVIALIIFNISNISESLDQHFLYILTLLPTMVLFLYTLDADIRTFIIKGIANSHMWLKLTFGISPRITPTESQHPAQLDYM